MPTTPVPIKEELMEIEAMDTQRPLLSIKENETMQMDYFPFQAMKLPASNAQFGSLNFLENPHNSDVQNHGMLSQKSEVDAAYANVFKKESANFELSKQNSIFIQSKFHSQNMGSSYNGIPSDTNQLQGSNFIVCGNSKKVLSSSSSTTLIQNNLPKKRTYSQINELSISCTTHQSPVNQETALHRGGFPNIGQFLTDLNQSKNSSFTFPSSNQQSSPTANNRILPPNVISPFSYLIPSNKPENMKLTYPGNQQSLSIQDIESLPSTVDLAACKSLVPKSYSCLSFPKDYQMQIPVKGAQSQISVPQNPSFSAGRHQNITAPGGEISSSVSCLEENRMEIDVDEATPSKMFCQRSTKQATSTKKKQQFYRFSQTKNHSRHVVCQQRSTTNSTTHAIFSPNPSEIEMNSSSLNQRVASGATHYDPVLPNCCSPANASDGECGMDWTEDNSCQTPSVPEVTVTIEREITECKVNVSKNKSESLMRKEKLSYKMKIHSAKALEIHPTEKTCKFF